MWFALAQIAAQGFAMDRAQEAQRVGWDTERQLREIASQQEIANAEAQAAARTADYNRVMEAQDLIFGTQGRKAEGSVTALYTGQEQQYKRDISLIKASGQARAQMQRAGTAGMEAGLIGQQAAQSGKFAADAASLIAKQVS